MDLKCVCSPGVTIQSNQNDEVQLSNKEDKENIHGASHNNLLDDWKM